MNTSTSNWNQGAIEPEPVKPLDPPDLTQCQCIFQPSPFTLGGDLRPRQCDNTPLFIATENHPGEDGRIGSMSLCAVCAANMKRQMGENFATLTPIEKEAK